MRARNRVTHITRVKEKIVVVVNKNLLIPYGTRASRRNRPMQQERLWTKCVNAKLRRNW